MIRLTTHPAGAGVDELVLEGWLGDEDVPLLLQEGSRLRQPGRCLLVDLHGLRGVGSIGIAVLKRWIEEGVRLERPTLFVRALLRAHGLELPEGAAEGGELGAHITTATSGTG